MKILICGTRYVIDKHRDMIKNVLINFDPLQDIIIHGGAPGVDSTAGNIAQSMGFKVLCVMADWKKYGKGAGPMRNSTMIQMNPDLVVAFPYPTLEKSIGTFDTVKKARNANIKVEILQV